MWDGRWLRIVKRRKLGGLKRDRKYGTVINPFLSSHPHVQQYNNKNGQTPKRQLDFIKT
jgi:hypothetical protein